MGNKSVSKILLFIGATASLLWSAYFSVVTVFIPYQIEFREGTALVLTKILMDGGNPFSFENQPLGMTNYGLGYNLAVLPFAMLFGNTLAVHRALTFIFILLVALVVFLSLNRSAKEPALALACSAFVMTGLIANGGIGAFPSAMGTFLFYLVVLVPFARSFDRAGLFASVLISLASFYTKPYFILGFGIVASYLFIFVSKKRSVVYIAQFLFLFAISFLIVRYTFPLYFINTIVGNISNAYRTLEHLVEQLGFLLLYFYPALILALFVLFGGLLINKGKPSFGNERGVLFAWDKPLVAHSGDYILYSLACSLLAFLFILGPHVGTDMYYAYQLIVPLFFYWLFQNISLDAKYANVIALVILFNLYWFGQKTISPNMLKEEDPKKWTRLINAAASSSSILNSPVITANTVELGLNPVDSGQTIYYYAVEPYQEYSLMGPSYDVFQSNGLQYIQSIDESIKRQKFDLIMTTDGEPSFYHEYLLSEYYSIDSKIAVNMPQTNRTWKIFLWKPLPK
ncbi:MAG: hypothetical protein K8S20_05470 [Chloroflexi bacterium]|nr:hypothetical protein [Chloroflexota bacterium]